MYANLPLILYGMTIIGSIIIPLLFFVLIKIPTIIIIKTLLLIFVAANSEDFFILTPKNELITLNETAFDQVFSLELSRALTADKDRIYGITSETQGIVKTIKNHDEIWLVGFKYNISSKMIIAYLILGALILLSISIAFLLFTTNDLANDIRHVSINLNKIANRSSLMEHQKLPITSYPDLKLLSIFQLLKNHLSRYPFKNRVPENFRAL